MVSIVSADIVHSTSLETKDLIKLRRELSDLFGRIAADYPGFWARIIRGDSVECYVPDPSKGLRVALLVKLLVKTYAGTVPCSEQLKHFGIRFSIGVGSMRYVSEEEDIMDGPAIYFAGRNLAAMKRNEFSAFELESGPSGIRNLLDSYVSLIDSLVNGYSAKQSQVIYYKLLGVKERQISELLGIYQSAVNNRSSLAEWDLLATALKDFENIDFEKLCG